MPAAACDLPTSSFTGLGCTYVYARLEYAAPSLLYLMPSAGSSKALLIFRQSGCHMAVACTLQKNRHGTYLKILAQQI